MIKNNEITIVRDEPITEKNMTVPTNPVSANELREVYLNQVTFFMKKLQRSVCKKYDPAPSPAALQREIVRQKGIVNEILFLQNCRLAIEQAVESGRGEAKGEKTTMAFIRKSDGLVQAISVP